ncbi:MAG: MarC family protein [Desulfarculales bacterium]|jgi:multiple antibiotic resistance protein|nr:MarC family protein [Desulfarculales bacterium]
MEFLIAVLSATLKIFALMTPPAVLGAFLGATGAYDGRRKKITALRSALGAFSIGFSLYWLGDYIFEIFAISLDAFRIGAGTLLFLTAVTLMNEDPEKSSYTDSQDVSIVPLAIPLCMGPATIGTIMVWGATSQSMVHKVADSLALFLASAGIYVMLRLSAQAKRLLGRTGLAAMAKLTGLLLAAIAAQVVFTGIQSFLRPN